MLLKFDSDLGQFAKLMNSWEISSRLGSYGEVNSVIRMLTKPMEKTPRVMSDC